MMMFSLPNTSTPEQVRDAIKAEVQRRLNQEIPNSGLRYYKAHKRGEASAYESIIWFLDHLEFREPLKEPSHDRQD